MSASRLARPASLLAATLVLAGLASWPARSDGERSIDLAGVTAVRLTGEASDVRLTAGSGEPHVARLGARRTGWFARWSSAWLGSACRERAHARLDGATLLVEVEAPAWLDLSDCVTEIRASLPAGADVSIDQAALAARLDGDFGAVAIRARAADVALGGHAGTVSVEGEAIRARLDVEGSPAGRAPRAPRTVQTVRRTGKAMDAELRFPDELPVSWRVTAAASFVDGRRPSRPDAQTTVAIDGEFVRATIR